jgi:WhiB family redox-sensing transcriptional regulator
MPETFPPRAEAWTWQLLARCRGEDVSVFFHPDGERGHDRKRRQQRAKAICAKCPVAAKCREHSLISHERFGTWGGLSEDERASLFNSPQGPQQHQ